MFDQPGFLGTNASLASDLTLIAYVLILVPLMLVGFAFARRKSFTNHKYVMTAIVLLNWVLIGFVMSVSYQKGVAPYVPDYLGDARVFLPVAHLVTGGIAQLLATYLIIRMWFEKILPQAVMVRNIKRYMRLTLALWLITVALGVVIYILFYVPSSTAGDSSGITPASTEEARPQGGIAPISTEEPASAPPDPAATEEVNAPVDRMVLAPSATVEVNQADDRDDDSGQGRGRGRGRGGDDDDDRDSD